MKLLTDDSAVEDEHPVDRHYRQLACDIRPLDDNHPTVQLVKDYVKMTHGKTHHFGLEVEQASARTHTHTPHTIDALLQLHNASSRQQRTVRPNALDPSHSASASCCAIPWLQVYAIERSGEEERYKAHAADPNRLLLWHGSRTTNFVGILSQGLRIAPPEAPATGYLAYPPQAALDDTSLAAAAYSLLPSRCCGFDNQNQLHVRQGHTQHTSYHETR